MMPSGRNYLLTFDHSFSEAIEPLLEVGFMKRDKDARVFSCHRMVQTQFRFFLPLEERQKAFDNAVALVYRAFPKQSNNVNSNQLYQHWLHSAYFVQGVLHRRGSKPEAAEASFMEAQNLWMKGDQTRLHPFYAGCLYKTGVVCLDQGKVGAAVCVN